MTEHICEVCFQPSWRHHDPGYFSPRCCHGCPCGITVPMGPTDETAPEGNSVTMPLDLNDAPVPEGKMPSPYQSRHLTLTERRCIAHALRQMADAARSASSYEAPLGAEAVEIVCAEARDHDRLAGLIERNGLRFTDPSEGE